MNVLAFFLVISSEEIRGFLRKAFFYCLGVLTYEDYSIRDCFTGYGVTNGIY